MGKGQGQWWDRSWNPIVGCTRISEGCKRCWAQSMLRRFGYPLTPTFYPHRLNDLRRWRKPSRVFLASWSDLGHPSLFIPAQSVLRAVAESPQHTFFALTKRTGGITAVFMELIARRFSLPIRNLTLGASVENQLRADERVDALLELRPHVGQLFLSVEPMLAGIRLTLSQLERLDWIVCGAETGIGARPLDLQWARDLRDQCRAAGVPFWFKSAGGMGKRRVAIPEDLQIRERPG